jgi:protein gp37
MLGPVSHWGPGAPRHITSEAYWHEPLKWARQAKAEGRRHKVFTASQADIFDIEAPAEKRRALWQLIGDTCEWLDWQIVTKRPQNIPSVMDDDRLNEGFFELAKCWLITSTEDQRRAEQRIPLILDIPTAVHGISAEPLLDWIDLDHLEMPVPPAKIGGTYSVLQSHVNRPLLDWVICGGESGPGARPMRLNWARGLRDQCVAAGVPFFFKQWGQWHPTDDPNVARARGVPIEDCMSWTASKKAAGALLDGLEWKQFPESCV